MEQGLIQSALAQMGQEKKTSSTYSQNCEQHEYSIKRLFARLSAMYGKFWIEFVGQDANAKLVFSLWCEELRDYSNEQIKRGLDNLESRYPPSLPEFKKLCLTVPAKDHPQQIATRMADEKRKAALALPKPKPQPEKVCSVIDACRSALRG